MSAPLLLCFDGSEEAATAVERAGALLAGREVLVLTVATPAADGFPLDPLDDLVGKLSRVYEEWDEICVELAERHAREGCQLAGRVGLAARPLTALGKPVPTILRIADEHDVAVIVLGAHRGALGGLLGSVAAGVVHRARRPVLVIPDG
jgi:nucleotide-binding universal stress UspA family protein